jgi:hypothetical protein
MPFLCQNPDRPMRLVVLGDARPGDREAVSALAFSTSGSMLLAAHVSGAVVLWQWHRNVWEPVKTIRGGYHLPEHEL